MSIETNDAQAIITPTPAQELAELTGIPESQITPEQIDKYELAKSIDAHLDLLTVKAELDISQKIMKLNELLERSEDITWEESIIDSAISWGTEALQTGIEQTLEGAEDWGKTQVENKLGALAKIPLIGEWLSKFVFDTLKSSYENNKGWIMTAILGYFGFESIMEKYADLRNAVVPEEETVEENIVISEEVPDTNTAIAGIETEDILSETRNTARTAWYRMIGKLSWLPTQWYETEIMWDLNASSQSLQSIEYKISRNDGKALYEVYQIDARYSDEQISRVVAMLIWPYNREFFDYQLEASKLQNILWQDPNYSETAKKFFTDAELESISEENYDYSAVSIGILSRLSVVSMGQYVRYIRELPSEFAGKLWTVFRDVVHDEELTALISGGVEANSYPKSVSDVFTDLLTSDADSSIDIDYFKNIAAGKDIDLSEADISALQSIIVFNQNIRSQLSTMSLWLDGFDENIDENLTWQKLLSLYAITGWENVDQIEWFGKIMIFTWIHWALSGTMQWNYETKILEHIADDNSQDSLVLQAVAFQILEIDRNRFLEVLHNTKWRIDGAVEYIVPGVEDIEDEWMKWIAINLIETWSIALALKFLWRMPITKAVLIATSGMIGTLVYVWIKEWLHEREQSEIWRRYKDFIEEIAPRIWYDSANTLIDGINDGSVSMWDMLASISPEDMASEALGEIFYNNISPAWS